MDKNQALYKKAKQLIPGGTQLLSKRPELHLPGLWPTYYQKAKGCRVWDLNGRELIDTSYMGIGACILGYADPDVNSAVKTSIDQGSMTTLNCPEEVELAELLCQLHPWAKMARFARTGGEAMSVAVRIARAFTQKSLILFCGYHGWHDWYLAANIASIKGLDGHLLPGLMPSGVSRKLRSTSMPFAYNDTEGFLKLIAKYGPQVGAVVMEPIRNFHPEENFLETVRRETRKHGIVLIFDEVSSGWRLTLGGAHLKFKIDPDMAVFAKGISNGYPMAAIIGKKDVMNAAQESFISSTYWTERTGPVAALATIRKLKKYAVAQRLIEIGTRIKEGWMNAAKKQSLRIHVGGMEPLAHFAFEDKEPAVLKTLFTQEMLGFGFLATTAFYSSLAHTDLDVEKYLKAVNQTFGVLSRAVGSTKPQQFLKGDVCHSGFKRLT
ncbi:MAG: aminotransferase class III-fold pyridoxal phosphate-dependent enzyme [Candidatus Omnitrophica bacterium]|nr:aminotransferase class III-fold pyridoxal phosphate-dependent enzyme [Candidatus Omnitrophota bacterium]